MRMRNISSSGSFDKLLFIPKETKSLMVEVLQRELELEMEMELEDRRQALNVG